MLLNHFSPRTWFRAFGIGLHFFEGLLFVDLSMWNKTPLEQLFVIFMFIAVFTWWLYSEGFFNDIIDYFKKSKSEKNDEEE